MPRRLGQHFLVREGILRQIAIAACCDSTPRVIEIGPGKGALTKHLLECAGELHVIELDGGLAEYLRTRFNHPKLDVVQGDVLETDLTRWGAAVIAGNLPYYITSPIIHAFLRLDHRFARAVFLMQEEVAERVLAVPGTRAYGYLSVSVQIVCEAERVCRVPAAAFLPPPKVDSAVLLLRRKHDHPPELESLLKFVGRCFAHKRKTLRNNLIPYYGLGMTGQPEAGMRAEQLSIAQFQDLYARLKSPTTHPATLS